MNLSATPVCPSGCLSGPTVSCNLTMALSQVELIQLAELSNSRSEEKETITILLNNYNH